MMNYRRADEKAPIKIVESWREQEESTKVERDTSDVCVG